MSSNQVAPAPTQRIGALLELPALLTEFGADPEAVFAGSGLNPAALDPDMRLSFPELLRLIDRAVSATGCPHLGLLCGLRFRFEHHGIIGRLMQTAATTRQALEDFVFWQPGYSSGAVVYFYPVGHGHAFGYGCYAGSAPGTRALYDGIMGIGARMIQELAGDGAAPVEFLFSYRRPEDLAPYARLRAPVRFNQNHTCLILDSRLLDRVRPGANAAARARLLEEIRLHLPEESLTWAARVRAAVRRKLLTEGHSMVEIAADLGLPARTLRRRLNRESATFEGLRDEVRLTVARELLELTDVPVGDVAAAVGLASPGVFSESFRRWTGHTPSEWRSAKKAKAP